MNSDAVRLGDCGEDGSDCNQLARVVVEAFKSLVDGLTGRNRRNEEKNFLAPDHLLDIVPENELTVRVELGSDDCYVLALIDSPEARLSARNAPSISVPSMQMMVSIGVEE